ncbi:MAG: MarR family winged helix-turn-helix transcriptional regulator [Janthinobacterium lividum]
MSTTLSSFEFDPQLKLEEQTCFPVYALSRLITKAYQPLLAPLSLTYPQYLVMLLLWEHQELAVKDIGQKLLLDTGTLTPLLKLLEQRELLSRRRDPCDERSVLIRLLPDGAALHGHARQIPQQLGQRYSLTRDDVALLRQELHRLIDVLS